MPASSSFLWRAINVPARPGVHRQGSICRHDLTKRDDEALQEMTQWLLGPWSCPRHSRSRLTQNAACSSTSQEPGFCQAIDAMQEVSIFCKGMQRVRCSGLEALLDFKGAAARVAAQLPGLAAALLHTFVHFHHSSPIAQNVTMEMQKTTMTEE